MTLTGLRACLLVTVPELAIAVDVDRVHDVFSRDQVFSPIVVRLVRLAVRVTQEEHTGDFHANRGLDCGMIDNADFGGEADGSVIDDVQHSAPEEGEHHLVRVGEPAARPHERGEADPSADVA